MSEEDRDHTERCVPPVAAGELEAAGFEDVREIGSGGFGVVFRCVQPDLDRVVAVKVVEREAEPDTLCDGFQEERALGRMTGHPNIVNLLEIGRTPSGRRFFVMPYFANGSLSRRIREYGTLSLEEVLRLGVRLSGAIATAHRLGVVHSDVKPGNILVSDYSEPVLSDFGIARIGGHNDAETGVIAGSVAFSAPELFGGAGPTPASDVYGLGASMLCALTGYETFDRHTGETPVEQAERIASVPAAVLSTAGMADDVRAAIGAAMAREPGDRPSAVSFGEQLQRIQADRGFPVDEVAVLGEQDDGGRALLPRRRPQASTPAGPMSSGEGNLPLTLTSFVDRRAEVTAAKNALAVSRLVTVVGIGGAGKTRLALRIAEKTRSNFPDGVWIVELAELRDGSLVAESIAGTLRLRSQSARSPLEVLAESLAARTLLLVLDNCEHIVDTVADIVATLLRRCPGLRVLATSREPLGIEGETLLHVPPLPVPETVDKLSVAELPQYDAVTLFTERAAAAVPGFEVTEANCVTVARICAVLDGLPLAIELTAARLTSMSLDQIAARLASRYTLLTHGRRGAPARHQTLRAAIDWSYELCTATEQATWARLSVFAGSFELDAAEELLAGDLTPTETLDTLSNLLDKSILNRVEVEGIVRFRMLDTIRDYGHDRLERSNDAERWHRRHREWYERLAVAATADWISARQRDSIDRLVRELPNLREALAYTMTESREFAAATLHFVNALYLFWLARGMLSEGRYWIDRARGTSVDTGSDKSGLTEALSHAVVFAGSQGDLENAGALVAEAKSLGAGASEAVVRGHVLHAEGYLALFAGDLPRARSCLQGAYDVVEAGSDLGRQVEILLPLAWAHTLSGNCTEALAWFDQAQSITETHGEEVFRSYSSWGTGVAMWKLGRLDGAERALRQGTALATSRDDPFVASLCIETLAWLAGTNGDAIRAATLLAVAEKVARMAGCAPVIFPALWRYHEECVEATSSVLGAAKVESARRHAFSLSLSEATALALGETVSNAHAGDQQLAGLTRRESEVAELVGQGMTNKAIAAKLVISQRTVHGHVEHILSKLGFTSRTQIAAWVARGG
ncbi:protein kinase [Rhodococcus sp. ABRD24]|uniref:protein kinase domain-containing protein n=1 Tax=Rhodococcus sp. ABRD24 TaxID=2507582 RepID=UPI00103FEA4E|nr:protein kinase [Rhodococcus sp. ABRD24]QBJ95588.1 protein kinase [Rhodococcus sp. ABRD24]